MCGHRGSTYLPIRLWQRCPEPVLPSFHVLHIRFDLVRMYIRHLRGPPLLCSRGIWQGRPQSTSNERPQSRRLHPYQRNPLGLHLSYFCAALYIFCLQGIRVSRGLHDIRIWNDSHPNNTWESVGNAAQVMQKPFIIRGNLIFARGGDKLPARWGFKSGSTVVVSVSCGCPVWFHKIIFPERSSQEWNQFHVRRAEKSEDRSTARSQRKPLWSLWQPRQGPIEWWPHWTSVRDIEGLPGALWE